MEVANIVSDEPIAKTKTLLWEFVSPILRGRTIFVYSAGRGIFWRLAFTTSETTPPHIEEVTHTSVPLRRPKRK